MRHPVRYLLVALLAISISFNSKAQQPTTALELNNYIANITDSLYKGGQAWGSAFGEAYKSGQYDQLKLHRVRLGNFIDQKLDDVLILKDINNSKPLRLAIIEFLSYEKRLLQEAFIPFESLKPGVSQEEVRKMVGNLQTIAAKEKDVMALVNNAQIKYADENGFALK